MFISGFISPFNWLLTGRGSPGAGEQMEDMLHIQYRPESQVLSSQYLQDSQKKSHRSFIRRQNGVYRNHPKRTFPSKNLSQGDITEKLFILYTASSKNLWFGSWTQTFDGWSTMTIKLEGQLLSSPVFEKNPVFMMPCRSQAWCQLYFKTHFLMTCDAGNWEDSHHLALFKHPKDAWN